MPVDLLEDAFVVHRRRVIAPQQGELSGLCGVVADFRQSHAAMPRGELRRGSCAFRTFAELAAEGGRAVWKGLVFVLRGCSRSAAFAPVVVTKAFFKKILHFERLLSLTKGIFSGDYDSVFIRWDTFSKKIIVGIEFMPSTTYFWITFSRIDTTGGMFLNIKDILIKKN